MYEIDINFLRDRPEYNLDRGSSSSKIIPPFIRVKLLYFSLASGTLLPVMVVAGWLLLQNQNARRELRIGEIDAQLLSLDSQLQQVKKNQGEADKINRETQSLVSVFDQIRPLSAILQDLRDRIPRSVQIETLKQIVPAAPQPGQPTPKTAVKIEISGMASSFNDVNDFLLTLQQSALFNPADTKIVTAELLDSPMSKAGDVSSDSKAEAVKLSPVVRYTIQANLSDIPASKLIQELEHNGAVGLVARIRTLQLKKAPTEKILPHLGIQKSDLFLRPGNQQATLKTSTLTLNNTEKLAVTGNHKNYLSKALTPSHFSSHSSGELQRGIPSLSSLKARISHDTAKDLGETAAQRGTSFRSEPNSVTAAYPDEKLRHEGQALYNTVIVESQKSHPRGLGPHVWVHCNPTAFWITLTPTASRALIAVSGLAAFLFLLLKRVRPGAAQKPTQVKAGQAQIKESQNHEVENQLTQTEHRLARLFSSIPDEKTFDMMLLELYQMINSGNASLTRFALSEQPAAAKADSFLEPTNNSAKHWVIDIAFTATSAQTSLILRDIERIPPLSISKDYQSTLVSNQFADTKGLVVSGSETVNTSLQLQAHLPVNPEESVHVADATSR